MDLVAVSAIAGSFAGVLGSALAVGLAAGRPIRRLARQGEEFREDWYGVPARPGRPAVPGVPERLSRIEGELRPNGGSTMRDAVNRLETRFEDHLRSHPTPPA